MILYIDYIIIDIIYKTLKPSHLKKMLVIQNIKNLMLQVTFKFSDWILIKQIIASSTPFCCWGKQIFERMLPGGVYSFILPRVWLQELGGEFWVGRYFICIAFSRNINFINLKFFPNMVEYKSLRKKFNKHSGEWYKARGCL